MLKIDKPDKQKTVILQKDEKNGYLLNQSVKIGHLLQTLGLQIDIFLNQKY